MTLNGEYIVIFKDPNSSIKDFVRYLFRGKCENFVPAGVCAFSNDNNEMLLVRYEDIVQMRLVK